MALDVVMDVLKFNNTALLKKGEGCLCCNFPKATGPNTPKFNREDW
jgi:hypothetical protein